MNGYHVTFSRSARRELEDIDAQHARRIWPRIEALSDNPRPPGCAKLKDSVNEWRIRIGDYRVIYRIDDHRRVVEVFAVRHRRDAYR